MEFEHLGDPALQRIIFQGAEEIQSLAVACSEVAASYRSRSDEHRQFSALGAKAMEALITGSEPRKLSLVGEEAGLGISAIAKWARNPNVSTVTHSRPYVRSWQRTRSLDHALADAS